MTVYGVTAAGGRLGMLALDELLGLAAPGSIVALARDPAGLTACAARGVRVRRADYDDPASLAAALAGVDRVLFISGSEVGRRVRQHANVIEAARKAAVSYLAYTSVLKGARSRLPLAAEHGATEQLLAESGLSFDVLRHGRYSENYLGALTRQIESGEVIGASGEGRISAATRADFAGGDVAALIRGTGGRVYEFAGDKSFSMAEFALALAELSGRPVRYRNLTEASYAKLLGRAGFPRALAAMLANVSALAGEGELQDASGDLSRLSGRPTTPIRDTIRQMLAVSQQHVPSGADPF